MNTNTTTRTEGQQPGPCITGSQALLESFLREGVDTLFGYPGGAIIPVYDALFDYRDRLRHILVRHEQGAVHAAQGYARVSGRVGVCLVTSGPGATNTVTGLADALMDSTPLVLVTGQVGSSLLGTDAFQETNFVGITQAVTKWNCQVKRTEDIPGAIAKAFYIARSGRPGPVVVDITKDAQCGTAPFRYERLTSIRSYVPAPAPAAECIAEAVRLIDAAQRPLLMAGQGVMLGNAEEELQAFLAKSGIPVASTLLGLSAVPTSSPQYVGMLGMHGNYGPNIRNQECDLLIAVGMRFDDRVTGNPKCFGANAKVIHLEIDPAAREVRKAGRVVELTYKEYSLLRLLLENTNLVVTRETILQVVWGTDISVESRTVDMHIRTLRKKLGDAGKYICTVRKVGYKLTDEEEAGEE